MTRVSTGATEIQEIGNAYDTYERTVVQAAPPLGPILEYDAVLRIRRATTEYTCYVESKAGAQSPKALESALREFIVRAYCVHQAWRSSRHQPEFVFVSERVWPSSLARVNGMINQVELRRLLQSKGDIHVVDPVLDLVAKSVRLVVFSRWMQELID